MKQQTKHARFFAYLRVSGAGQVEGDGFERQLAAVCNYAQANGIKVARIFREEGVSGKKDLANRPALQELVTALHSNGVRLVLIEKLDRLARDLMVHNAISKRTGQLKTAQFSSWRNPVPPVLESSP